LVFEHIFRPVDGLCNPGNLTIRADGCMQQCYPVIWAWMADNFQNIHLHWIKQPHCTAREGPKSSFKEGNSLSWQLRDYRLNIQMMILATHRVQMERQEAKQVIQDRAVGTSQDIVCNWKWISLTTILVPDILHPVYLGMPKYLMDWVVFVLE